VGWDATVYGTAALSPRHRADRFAEMVEALDGLLTHGEYSFTGEHYVIADARTLPGPRQPRLPLAVAAAGPRALDLAARFGDAWITIGDPWHDESAAGTERAVRDQSRRLDDACVAAGRDPADLDRIVLAGSGEERPLASVAAFEEYVGRYAAIGITDVVVHHPRADDPNWDDPPDSLDRIADSVLPSIRRGDP
jgi:alkanesulfonate monooxygenase SsuD/methylene tetrahydromethanopterin reductase-like flavin-dependent oxidoreductase (luciferase family)